MEKFKQSKPRLNPFPAQQNKEMNPPAKNKRQGVTGAKDEEGSGGTGREYMAS